MSEKELDKIKSVIKDKGIKKTVIADKIDVSPTHFYNFLAGKAGLSRKTRDKLIEFLDVEI